MKHTRMQNLSIAKALKEVPADSELVFAFDPGINLWVVFFNIDSPANDAETGEPCESGMKSIPVAEFDTEAEAEGYVKKVYQLDVQLQESEMSLDDYIKQQEK